MFIQGGKEAKGLIEFLPEKRDPLDPGAQHWKKVKGLVLICTGLQRSPHSGWFEKQ